MNLGAGPRPGCSKPSLLRQMKSGKVDQASQALLRGPFHAVWIVRVPEAERLWAIGAESVPWRRRAICHNDWSHAARGTRKDDRELPDLAGVRHLDLAEVDERAGHDLPVELTLVLDGEALLERDNL